MKRGRPFLAAFPGMRNTLFAVRGEGTKEGLG